MPSTAAGHCVCVCARARRAQCPSQLQGTGVNAGGCKLVSLWPYLNKLRPFWHPAGAHRVARRQAGTLRAVHTGRNRSAPNGRTGRNGEVCCAVLCGTVQYYSSTRTSLVECSADPAAACRACKVTARQPRTCMHLGLCGRAAAHLACLQDHTSQEHEPRRGKATANHDAVPGGKEEGAC